MLAQRGVFSTRKLGRDGVVVWTNFMRRSASQNGQTTPVQATANTATLNELLQPLKKSATKEQKISRAMMVYLERANSHKTFLKQQNEEFSLGKRHLANIMGWDPDNITQSDIDTAIEYLLPSGLFEPRARPLMKPPEEIFPRQKAAQFDHTGRPFHFLFYTTRPNFYSILHKAVAEISKLNKHQANMQLKGITEPSKENKLEMHDSRWMNEEELESHLLEQLSEEQFDYFLRVMTRLAEHPYSLQAKDFLMQYRVAQKASIRRDLISPLSHDEHGNPYVEARGGRKTAQAKVIVRGNGTGRVTLNGCISMTDYFADLKDRLQIMFPMQLTGLLNKVDVEATIFYRRDEYHAGEVEQCSEEELNERRRVLRIGEGKMCEAGALRHAIANALCSFVTPEEIELMRLAGLLTRDPRMRERKKPGQMGARRKYTWLKR